MAPASTPTLRSCSASRSAPCLVRTKNSVRPGRAAISAAMSTLASCCDGEDAVVHRRDLGLRRGDRVDRRVLEVAADQLVDAAVQRRGEQQPLAVRVGQVEQRGHGGHEAEVGHVVGLVQHRDHDVGQGALALLDEVLQPTGGGDDEVDAATQLVDLSAHGSAAIDGDDLQVEGLTQRGERVVHLLRELTRGHEHQTARQAALALAADQTGEHRQAEGERLAGAGGAPAEDVAPGQSVGDRARLDGERRVEVATRQRADEAVGQTEGGERRGRVVRLRGGELGRGVERELEVGLDRRRRTRRAARAAAGAAVAPGGAACGRAARGARGGGGTGRGGAAWHERKRLRSCIGSRRKRTRRRAPVKERATTHEAAGGRLARKR